MLVRTLYINKRQSDEFGNLSGSGAREEKKIMKGTFVLLLLLILQDSIFVPRKNKKQERHGMQVILFVSRRL